MDSQITMSKIDIDWLTSPIGLSVTSKASEFSNSFTAVTKLRQLNPEVDPDLIGQAISQANLKLKVDPTIPSDFLLTDDGLQQATRPAVARFRAEYILNRFKQQRIVDLTCGLGFDTYFLAKAGHKVTCIEKDQVVAAIAAHNLKDLNIEVKCADATSVSIPENTQLVFVDPARRNPSGPRNLLGQAKRMLDPNDWSPSWDFVKQLATKFRVIAKVAPGINEESIGEWDAYWISADGDLVETMLISGGTGIRSAVLINGDQVKVIEGGQSSLTKPVGNYLIVPNSALIRASALNYLAEKYDAGLVNEHIAWLTSETIHGDLDRGAAQFFKINSVEKFNEKTLAKSITTLVAGSLTVMTRGVELDPELLRKKILKNPTKGGPEVVLAIYRNDSGTIALVCSRLT
ncbi:MAG: hypothetical protein RLZZ571_1056 [Actinomycetota bacterium]